MGRWKSPQAAAKSAKRAQRESERNRKEKRGTLVLLGGFVVVAVGLCVADFLWLQSQAQQRQKVHHQNHKKHGKPETNVPLTNQGEPGETSPERKP